MSAKANLNSQVDTFVTALRRRQVTGAFNTAKQTVELARDAISSCRGNTAQVMINIIKELGKKIVHDEFSLELAIQNILLRVLLIIRSTLAVELADQSIQDQSQFATPASSLFQSAANSLQKEDYTKPCPTLKSSVLEEIKELLLELQTSYNNITKQAPQHIQSGEVVMTIGQSRTVEEFIKSAGRKNQFHVIVPETAPRYSGRETACSLAEAGIKTTLIPDSNIFAVMPKVSKVIIGTHAVMANGGLVAFSGAHILVEAAKFHSVPVVVCVGLYKLSPLFPWDQHAFSAYGSPCDVLDFEQADVSQESHIQVLNPTFDYIPPELVTLFITNLGCHNPTYIYRLLAEHYHPEDHDLFNLQARENL